MRLRGQIHRHGDRITHWQRNLREVRHSDGLSVQPELFCLRAHPGERIARYRMCWQSRLAKYALTLDQAFRAARFNDDQ